MKFDFNQTMTEAMRLMQKGDLQAATAAIQAGLATPSPVGPAAGDAVHDVIDVEARLVSEPIAEPSYVDETEDAPDAPSHAKDRDQRGQFVSGTHADARDRRDYKMYIPPGAGDQPLPLVVMLHGCTQNPEDFAAGTAMNEAAAVQGFYVLYPAQSRKANPQGCWNWFKHSHQQRGRGEPALIAGMVHAVMARHDIDPGRVYVAGLSAGGAMAAILGETYPELFAAVGVHSGLANGAATDLPSALAAMNGGARLAQRAPSGVPTIVFHGDADGTVHTSNGAQVIAASVGTDASAQAERIQRPGLRDATRTVHRDAQGHAVAELWTIHGAPHAWSGGRAAGSYTDARGPDATAEMLRFFLAQPPLNRS